MFNLYTLSDWLLSAGNADNCIAIVQAGGIPPLIQLLKTGSGEGTVDAVDALGNLAGKNIDFAGGHACPSPPWADPHRGTHGGRPVVCLPQSSI